MKRKVQISKKLSALLRHTAVQQGLTMQEDGYVQVNQLLTLKSFQQVSFQELLEIVHQDVKQRFHLKCHQGLWFLRANQGHSLPVHVELQLILNPEELQPFLVHATFQRNVSGILSQGLSRMKRLYIHFYVVPGTLQEFKSTGKWRPSCDAFIYIKVEKAMQGTRRQTYSLDGILFYRSLNQVILSQGKEGILPTEYIDKITDSFGTLLSWDSFHSEPL